MTANHPTPKLAPPAIPSPSDHDFPSAPIDDPALNPSFSFTSTPASHNLQLPYRSSPASAPIDEYPGDYDLSAPIDDPSLLPPPYNEDGSSTPGDISTADVDSTPDDNGRRPIHFPEVTVLAPLASMSDAKVTDKISFAVYTFMELLFLCLILVAILTYAEVINKVHHASWGDFPYHDSGFGKDFASTLFVTWSGAAVSLPFVLLYTTTDLAKVPFLAGVVLAIIGFNSQGYSSQTATGAFIILAYLGIQYRLSSSLEFTRTMLGHVDSNPHMLRKIRSITDFVWFAQFVYNLLFAMVVTGFGLSTAMVNKSLPYVLIALAYIHYIWTCQVTTNILYACVSVISAAYHHPKGSPSDASDVSVYTTLYRVYSKSLGSIARATCVQLWTFPRLLFSTNPKVQLARQKYVLYNIATYGMDYATASKDIQSRLTQLNLLGPLPEQRVFRAMLAMYALTAGLLSGAYFALFVQENIHTLCIGILASMQMVYTASAGIDATVSSIFLAMAHDPSAFNDAHPELLEKMAGANGVYKLRSLV
ncbi:hypothetical protein BG004_004551 [Podila humilis]|nr:hypothetical protein BG004_004551 [Podila humilis]